MRTGSFSPPSPSGSVSGESFFLHDPQEIIYNRVKDLFDSDASVKDECPGNRNGNAMTVQVEVHSSSSGAASGSDEEISVDSSRSGRPAIMPPPKHKTSNSSVPNINGNHTNGNHMNGNSKPTQEQNGNAQENHDYEDIYLVREEAKNATKKLNGRSRSRDSGSHSRSASASSTRSTNDIVVQMANVNILKAQCIIS